MKVLFIGSCSSFFLVPLARALKAADPSIHLGVLDLVNPSGEVPEEEKLVFNELHVTPNSTIEGGKTDRLQKAAKHIAKEKGIGGLILSTVSGKLKSEVTQAESALVAEQNKQLLKKLFDRFDVVQVHYLKASNLRLAELVPADKLLLSFWGSDLLQDEDETSRKLKLKMLEKAKGITVQNQDLRQLIAVKYGWKHYEKIQTNLFLPNKTIFDTIKNGTRKEGIEWLRNFGPVDEQSITVSLGYNSHPRLRVKEVLEYLLELPPLDLSKLHFVFTFSYSQHKEEEEKIVAQLKALNVNHTVIAHYLSDEDMAKLRLSLDVLIHLTHTDAFSTTLLEHLYLLKHLSL